MNSEKSHDHLDIFGMGVSVMDVVMVVDELPMEEVVVAARQRRISLGGGVAVATATAALLGGRVGFADRLGDDVMSQNIAAALNDAGVDVSAIEFANDGSASIATIWVRAESGSRTIVFSPGSVADLQWNERLAERVSSSRIFHCNGRHLLACQQAIEVAKVSGTRVSFDGGAHRYRAEVLPLVCASDVLIVSKHFAAAHARLPFERADPAELVELLAVDFDAEIIGVTDGARGSWFALRGADRWHEPARTVDGVVDTTGCGDTFHGAFLFGLARGASPQRCSQLASAVAAINTQSLGALAIDRRNLGELLRGEFREFAVDAG